jgi:hypothetical protein
MSLTNYPNGLTSFGIPMVGNIPNFGPNSQCIFCDPSGGSDGNVGTSPDTAVQTLARAYSLLNNNSGDVLFLFGTASANLTTPLVWAKNLCSLIGVCSPVTENKRARIGQGSLVLSPMITVSGYGNYFANFYTQSGNGNAGNLVGMQVTGARNCFENVHFGGPFNATEAGTAGYMLVQLSGAQECTFRKCAFGTTTVARSAANCLVEFDSNAGRINFEDCEFLSMASATSPLMLNNSAVNGIVDFVLCKDCTFINFSVNWAEYLAAAIANAGGNSGAILLQNCMFAGITAIGAAGNLLRTFILGNEVVTVANQGLASAL